MHMCLCTAYFWKNSQGTDNGIASRGASGEKGWEET